MPTTLYVNFTQFTLNLSPLFCDNGSNEVNIMEPMFRGLYKFGESGVQGDLVESETMDENAQVWTLRVRTAVWSNDLPVTAYDFQKTWTIALQKNLPNSHLLLCIQGAQDVFEHRSDQLLGVEVLDDRTLRIKLEHPMAYFREVACHTAFKPVFVEEDVSPYTSEDFAKGRELIVNGNYRLSLWTEEEILLQATVPDQEFVFISFTFETDYSILATRLHNGTLDVHDGGSFPDIEASLQLDPYLQLHPFLSNFYLMVNAKSPLLQEASLRRFLSGQIDRSSFQGKDDKVPATHLIPECLVRWPRQEQFKSESAGRSLEGMKLKMICNNEHAHIRTCRLIQDTWHRRLGLEVDLSIYPWDEFIEKLENGEYDVARGGWVADFSDPIAFFEIFASYSPLNFPKWKNEEYDRLLQRARESSNEAMRNEIYGQLETLICEEAPVLPVYFHSLRQTVGPRLEGYSLSPSGTICYERIKRVQPITKEVLR